MKFGISCLIGFVVLWPLVGLGGNTVPEEGERWGIAQIENRVREGELEKFLNAVEVSREEEAAYELARAKIMAVVVRQPFSDEQLASVVTLLDAMAAFRQDTAFSTVLAGQLQDIRLSRRGVTNLERRYEELAKDRERLLRNAHVVLQSNPIDDFAGKNAEDLTNRELERQEKRERELMPIVEQIARDDAERKEIRARQGLLAQAEKVEFQKLVCQLFVRRRHEHVLLGCRIYRWVFSTTDVRFLDAQLEDGLSLPGGGTPTLGKLESHSLQMIERSRQSAEGFRTFFEHGELNAAAECLRDGLIGGGHLPGMRQLARNEKRMVLGYLQTSARLQSLIQTKDYGEARRFLAMLRNQSRDFSGIAEEEAVERGILFSNFALGRFRRSRFESNGKESSAHLAEALSLWPKNPGLSEYLLPTINGKKPLTLQ